MNIAYRSYYTHAVPSDQESSRSRHPWLWQVHHAWQDLIGLSDRLVERDLMGLNGVDPGRVLDIGCGNGQRLARLQSLGWTAQGQDVDPTSSAVAANTYGFPVFVGTLEDAGFADNTFDAVISNHVIEHVHDPDVLLAEAYRVLKPGGRMVVVTPNACSLGFRIFGRNWMGLDPPRHLRVFSPLSLASLSARSGVHAPIVQTSPVKAEPFAEGSLQIRHKRRLNTRENMAPGYLRLIGAMAFATFARFYHVVRPDSGEECILWAQKPTF